jgi:hypothetical protein
MTTRFDTISVMLMSLGMNSVHLEEEEREVQIPIGFRYKLFDNPHQSVSGPYVDADVFSPFASPPACSVVGWAVFLL